MVLYLEIGPANINKVNNPFSGMDSKLRVLAKGAGLAALGLFISKALTYLYRALVAQTIGPEAYGLLSLGLAAMNLAIVVSILGMNQGLQNYVAKYRTQGNLSRVRGVINSASHLAIPFSIISASILFFSAEWISTTVFNNAGLVQIIKILAFVPPFATLSKISIATTIGFEKIKYRVITNQIFQNIVQVAVTAVLIHPWFGLSIGVQGAAYGWLAGVVLSSILAYYFMQKLINPLSGEKDYSRKKLLRYSYPLFLTSIIGTALGWTDTMLLGYFTNASAVGLYNAALPTALLILVPYQAFNSLALPSMSGIVEKRKEDLPLTLKTLTRWTFTVTFPGFVLMALFSKEMLRLLFGADFQSASLALIILASGYMFNTAVGHLQAVVKALDQTKILFRNSIAQLGLNVVLNLALIPEWGLGLGLLGAAIATAASIIFVNTLLIAEVYYFEGFFPFVHETWKPIGSVIPALGIVYYALHIFFETVPVWALLPGAIVFGSIYIITFILIGGVEEDDRDIIIGIFRRVNKENLGEKISELIIRKR